MSSSNDGDCEIGNTMKSATTASTTTHENIMQEGGFTIVSNSSSGRRFNQHQSTPNAFSSWKKKKKSSSHPFNASPSSLNNHHDDFIEFHPTKFEVSLERVREPLSGTICSVIEKYFHPSSPILQIICYGIGDFISDKVALSQFKVLLEILEYFKKSYTSHRSNQNETSSENNTQKDEHTYSSVKCYMYDPVFEIKMSTSEREKLYRYIKDKFGMEWIEKNEECKRRIDTPTFVYMPHCAFSMYYNLLMENCDSLNNLILLSNQLPIRKEVFKSIFSMDEKKEIDLQDFNSLGYNSKIQKKKKILDDSEKYFLNFVFNNTNIYVFNKQERPMKDVEIFSLSSSEIDRVLNRESDVELVHTTQN
nr:unnamed protein product [Naegleria fowleri]